MNGSFLHDKLQEYLAQWLNPEEGHRTFQVDGAEVAIGSAIGCVREANEDRVLVARLLRDKEPNRNFFLGILCDGMGGMSRGGVCASLAISSFIKSLISGKNSDFSKLVETAAFEANNAVYEKFNGAGGTTLSAVVFSANGEALSVNVGDSRIYRLLAKNKLDKLTVDDTLKGQLEEKNKTAQLSLPEFRSLLQYIGMGEGLEPHIFNISPINDIKPIILTSDGIHSMPPETLKQLITNSQSVGDIVFRLITHSEWIGGHDNATSLSIKGDLSSTMSSKGKEFLNVLEVWTSTKNLQIWITSPSRVLANSFTESSSDTKYRTRNERISTDESVKDSFVEDKIRKDEGEQKITKPRRSKKRLKAGESPAEADNISIVDIYIPEINVDVPDPSEGSGSE
ncbi:PP2C family protein-serine/threonine phosphatase [Phormidium tenue]|uniref:PPM-type phosphatase domain-containing protein n=1 Tax=Phormidium tenue NIES-30 TaxID=549789 RepID=A0A1U7J5W9_9CYAN|nr:protein phosphatase 2C domain-containing protein [Phormidium tenue]MBD2232095.1 serine/threonine-protein phosphatase [Phormidium tenue FACHB-1052]OKH48318.1 hypothetical protein NIES30_09785 [Phormidium tenue NIES-30]